MLIWSNYLMNLLEIKIRAYGGHLFLIVVVLIV